MSLVGAVSIGSDEAVAQSQCGSLAWTHPTAASSQKPSLDPGREYQARVTYSSGICSFPGPGCSSAGSRVTFKVEKNARPDLFFAYFTPNETGMQPSGPGGPVTTGQATTTLVYRVNTNATRGEELETQIRADCAGSYARLTKVLEVGTYFKLGANLVRAEGTPDGFQWTVRVQNEGNYRATVNVEVSPEGNKTNGLAWDFERQFDLGGPGADSVGPRARDVTILARTDLTAGDFTLRLYPGLDSDSRDWGEPAVVPLTFTSFGGESSPSFAWSAAMVVSAIVAGLRRRR